MKIALLIDGGSIARWQADAIEKLGPGFRFTIFNCTNHRAGKRKVRHSLYYLLNILSLRTRLTRRLGVPTSLAVEDQQNFECEYEGAWQRLPDDLIERLNGLDLDCIVKFGMGLLRVPSALRLPTPILSYHHGDPRTFRGRPAGFYETLQGKRVIGQVIQKLSNTLDAGAVLAFAETKVHPHSYRQTMIEAFGASSYLLPQALRNAANPTPLSIEPNGKNYRLPSNWTVTRFAARSVSAKLRRLAYGMFIEKAWQVAEAPLPHDEASLFDTFPDPSSWRTLPQPAGYRFLADPFPHPSGEGVLVEALSSRNGRGEILHLGASGPRVLLSGKGHFSYPSTLLTNGEALLVPEVCGWSEPTLFRLAGDNASEVGQIDIDGNPRLIDPTLFERDGTTYLFANRLSEGHSILRLWYSNSAFDRFTEHPASPIRISPVGSRMGGAIVTLKGDSYRVGQDFSGQYGDGILLLRIRELSRTAYDEIPIKELRFGDRHGPHTLNLSERSILFDYYTNRFSLSAGVRRARSRWFGR